MNRIAGVLAVAGVALSIFPAFSAGMASEETFVFMRPDESSFWRTMFGPSMTLPVAYPDGAKSAELAIVGAGYERRVQTEAEQVTLDDLPTPSAEREENVYRLTLTFDDGTVQTATVGRIVGAVNGNAADSRCLLPGSGRRWGRVEGKAVLPVPFGGMSLRIGDADVETGLHGAQGWYVLALKSDQTAVAQLRFDEEENYMATLFGGFMGFVIVAR